MATKWKSKVAIILTAFLFTFGLSGFFFLSNNGYYYAQENYFETSEFRADIDEFTRYLTIYELNNIPLEEAKKSITVSDEEINEHRYRYGDLPQQIDEINLQYQNLIQGALDTDNQQVADAYIAERDEKINDITKNFESDEHVEAKVVAEKEQQLKEYYEERENQREEFTSYKKTFQYYFENSSSGEVYTNLNEVEGEPSLADINKTNMIYLTGYQMSEEYRAHLNNSRGYPDFVLSLNPKTGTFEGKIGIPNSLTSANQYMMKYENYKVEQIIFWTVVATSIVALFLSFYLMKTRKGMREEIRKWRSYYNKIPIDVRAVVFGLTTIVTIIAMFLIADQSYNIFDYPLSYGVPLAVGMMIASIGWALTFIQAKFLIEQVKDWKNLKNEWEKSFLFEATQFLKLFFNKVIRGLSEAFLHQSTGTQVFIVLGIVFGLGLASIMTFVHPVFVIFYIILLGAVGLPLAIVLINRIGYFNRIIEKTNELAVGNLGQDLQITGKSALATLASNVNVLKHGVKVSQNEQAKSERLKTELITNVSHDLRTPLTSIITYTELLKTVEITNEDSKAYLEIIDRKSKRLKVLIEDLFEVSKMASGNIELKKEKVDLVQLLQQALAEYDDTIIDSNLKFRVTNSKRQVYSQVDGQKLWRVFDNLIGNILKYSLENSRVYINLSTLDNQAVLTFKNISKYELAEDNNELFERFKRGDTSRHTEGSGLGLAIAQSIVDLHGGSLEMETDGDLFKVSIFLNLQE
ncbi:sensor histidine kinase [Aquibacillus saliphilus]|uniref:sensor histidine kinase n=1 Tax=Aquibacillus saliphilus TaxID=1909422 RepID=UPI001CF05984|nr:HAMP domain-containing sensor histidine kinase [Aquibacillus saliphilus]